MKRWRFQIIGTGFILMSAPLSLPAFASLICNSWPHGTLEVLWDYWVRFIYITTPPHLLLCGIGLCLQKRWAVMDGIYFSLILALTYFALSLEKDSFSFTGDFGIAVLFSVFALSLIKNRQFLPAK